MPISQDPKRWFVHGESFPDPLAMVDLTEDGDELAGSEEFLFYLKDALGSVGGLLGESGLIREWYTYSPYGITTIWKGETPPAGPNPKGGFGGEVVSGDPLDPPVTIPGTLETSAFNNPFMYTGQRYDAGLGLYHFWARTYDPQTGRWLQRDKLGVLSPGGGQLSWAFDGVPGIGLPSTSAGGEYDDGLNLHAYVRSNPITASDPTGLFGYDDDIDDVIAGMAMDRALAAQHAMQFFSNMADAAATMAVQSAIIAVVPGAGLYYAAMGMASSVNSMRENGITWNNALGFGLSAAGAVGGAAMLPGQVKGMLRFGSKLSKGLASTGAQYRARGGPNRYGLGICFVAGTVVHLADGSQEPIQVIECGMSVQSRRAPELKSHSEISQLPSSMQLTAHEEARTYVLESGLIVPSRWRTIKLAMDRHSGGQCTITLLRPLGWIEFTGAKTGAMIYLELSEMGLSGHAHVLAIGPCTKILGAREGGAQIVTGKFVTTNVEVIDLSIYGLSEPIGTTERHPFWSENRQGWVAVGDLIAGEVLRTADGSVIVAGIKPREEAETVYNIEVRYDHTFFVSDAKVWVHNACAAWPPGALSGKQVVAFLESQGFVVIRVKGSHHVMRNGMGRQTTVPVHRNQSLGRGLLKKM